MLYFDSHAHYNDEKFKNDYEEILEQVTKSNVAMLINAGADIETSKRTIEMSKKYDYMYSTVGISPNDIEENIEKINEQLEEIKELAHNEKVVAIGEIGLDYYWNKENKELQKYAFIEQIKIANQYKLPIQIHTREAVNDTLEILKNVEKPQNGAIFHCCPLNRELVKEGLKLGIYISLSGTVTFKNSKNADEIIKMIPLEKMLIETDSPYLSPEPNRGKRNDSRNLKYIVEKIAKTLEKTEEEIAKVTYENAKKVFRIEKQSLN